MDINRKIEVLCTAQRKKTKKLMALILKKHISKINMRRKVFERRLRRRLLSSSKLHQEMINKLISTYSNTVFKKSTRKIWMKKRCKNWWTNIANSDDFDEWVENFRVDKDTYKYLCDKLRDELKPKPQCVREALSVEIKVAIALYKLASCAEFRVVANQFGVHKTSVHRSLKQFCSGVIKILLPEEIKMPSMEEAEVICSEFEQKSGIPQILAAIDGCHIPVKPPSDGYRDYINRKTWASVILQGVVDPNYRFLDITVKHPGCTHDAVVLRDSFLFENIHNYARPCKLINGREIKAFLVGDPAYPLKEWLMKSYVSPQSPEEESFNVYLSKARIVVENAFGRLKSRWRILQKKMDTDISFVPLIVATCCVLHNITEKRKLPCNERWMRNAEENERVYPQPQCSSTSQELCANDIRNHLKAYVSQNLSLITSSRIRE